MKIAFMFSGQGAEKIGMCKDLYDEFDIVKETFTDASSYLGFDLANVCFYEEEKIKDTSYAQPALVTTSISILKLLNNYNINADYYLGLSLGEYSAFVASGALQFKDAVNIVRKRGQLMLEAFNDLNCGMTAVLNTDINTIEDVINEVKKYGILEIANYNTPKQTVISGETAALEKAEEIFKQQKNKFIRLGVKGAFHTSLLDTASKKLNLELNKISFSNINVPVITNVDASIVTDKNNISDILTKQIKQSVYFEKSIKNLIDEGVTIFIELGTGKTLSSFVKKINKSVTTLSIEDTKSLQKALEILKEN